jgi:predicted MPP superfamily phosphohydrolase
MGLSYSSPISLILFYLLHFYVYWKFRPCFTKRGFPIGSLVYFVYATFITAFPLALRFSLADEGARSSEILFALTITDFVVVGMTVAVLVFVDVVKIFLNLWDQHAKTKIESSITARRSAVFTLAVVLCGVFYGFYEVWDVRRVDIVITTEKLPTGMDRLRIVQVSDVHIGGLYWAGHLERVMKIVRDASPDIFVMTGDLVDGNMEYRSRESDLVASHGAKYGSFAVTGNHEYYYGIDQAVRFIERSGLTLLDGQAAEAAGIVVVGLDDFTERWPQRLEIPDDRFVILLKHKPGIPEGGFNKFDLQLSGHTHGGQIWVFNYAMQRRYESTQGLEKQGKSYVYVSNGAGFWGPPMRILAAPEVTVIDLVREESAPVKLE